MAGLAFISSALFPLFLCFFSHISNVLFHFSNVLKGHQETDVFRTIKKILRSGNELPCSYWKFGLQFKGIEKKAIKVKGYEIGYFYSNKLVNRLKLLQFVNWFSLCLCYTLFFDFGDDKLSLNVYFTKSGECQYGFVRCGYKNGQDYHND